MSKIAFIGLGIMGAPMALNLLRGGHQLYLHSRSGVPADLAAQGGHVCKSASDAARQAEIIIMMVPDTPDVEKVLFAENGVATALTPGKIVVDMSSISPIETKRFAARIRELQCEYLDAPVSGGDVGAKNGTLTIMVGGSQTSYNKLKPIFALMGKNVTLIGSNGAGQTCKIANQIIVALAIEAVAEAFVFASKSGVDVSKVRQALMGGFASSRVLELHGQRMIDRAFEPGFRVELHQKDLNLALNGARTLGVSLPNTATAQQLFNACVADGGGRQDHSALARTLEKMANHQIGQTEVAHKLTEDQPTQRDTKT
ncbi:MAG: 2-hydroxy-3-oxopropionate reductase [Acidobacteriales bacterium]|nr:2-hydroxy-3-oxopropionate reductase [Terriglobales bacterium]